MHIKSVHIKSFKAFTDLTIRDLPNSTRLVVMVGPNGCGKSSVFDAFRMWLNHNARIGWSDDPLYYPKNGLPAVQSHERVSIEFYEPLSDDVQERKKVFCIRSAYRNDPDFTLSRLERQTPSFQDPKVRRLIDNDQSVRRNYTRLVTTAVEAIWGGEQDDLNVGQLRENLIGQLRESMRRVFGGLVLEGTGNPLSDGSFFFEKGVSKRFHYKNLSGGEKAAFDLLLDLLLKRIEYGGSVFCIDEPEAHMHTQLQAALLSELMDLIRTGSQLWIATHSIGMMRRAMDLANEYPGEVVFLEFYDKVFDIEVVLVPAQTDRAFWRRTLNVGLDDLASLVAPKRIVLVEGNPVSAQSSGTSEFDATCYRTIFAGEYPDTEFVSVGNAFAVTDDRLQIGRSIQALIPGVEILKLVDRDDRSKKEIDDLAQVGVRVLTRRHLEAYLLDDEILSALCDSKGHSDLISVVLSAKEEAMADSEGRGNPPDDVKSASGEIFNATRGILLLTQCGNNARSFLRDTMTAYVVPGTQTYAELKRDIFGD